MCSYTSYKTVVLKCRNCDPRNVKIHYHSYPNASKKHSGSAYKIHNYVVVDELWLALEWSWLAVWSRGLTVLYIYKTFLYKTVKGGGRAKVPSQSLSLPLCFIVNTTGLCDITELLIMTIAWSFDEAGTVACTLRICEGHWCVCILLHALHLWWHQARPTMLWISIIHGLGSIWCTVEFYHMYCVVPNSLSLHTSFWSLIINRPDQPPLCKKTI